ncbi:MAG: ABC transporter [Ruminococcaceae bacterium]|nr:ABC transporter [Oscillospiraceae bacterium]
MIAIFKREFKAYFTSPLGYLVIAAMALFEGFSFVSMFANGYAANEYTILAQLSLAAIVIPVLTMRLFSEERKQKTDQVLITAPVSLWGIVFGKFASAFAVFALSFSPTLIYQVIYTSRLDALNWLIYLGALFGVLLYGAALIAICMFISSLTESQVVSAVMGIVVAMLLVNIYSFVATTTNAQWLLNLAEKISFDIRYQDFYKGIIDFSNIVFFGGIAFLFIFLTVRMLDKRRWA